LVANIGKPIYESTEMERSFGLADFDKNEPKNWNSIDRHLFSEVVGNSKSTINFNLELARTNSSLEYLTKKFHPIIG
jgi:hypothetical protein